MVVAHASSAAATMQASVEPATSADAPLGDKPSPLTATVPLRIVGIGPPGSPASSRSGRQQLPVPLQLEVLRPVTALAVRAAISDVVPSLEFELVVQGKRFAGSQEWPAGATVGVVPKAKAGVHLTPEDARSAMLKRMGMPLGLAAELDKLAGQLKTAGSDVDPSAQPKVMLVPVPIGPGGQPDFPPALLEHLLRLQQPQGLSSAGAGPVAQDKAPARANRPDSPIAVHPRERMQRQHDELRARAAEDAKARSSNVRMIRKLEMLRERRAASKAKKRRVLTRNDSITTSGDRPLRSAHRHSNTISEASGGSTKLGPPTKKQSTKSVTGMAGLRRGFLL